MFRNRETLQKIMFVVAIVMIAAMVFFTLLPLFV